MNEITLQKLEKILEELNAICRCSDREQLIYLRGVLQGLCKE